MEIGKCLMDLGSRPIVRGVSYHLGDLESSDLSSISNATPNMENSRLQQRHSSSLSSATSARSVKTSKTVATSSMTLDGMKTVSVRSTSASTTKSSFSGSTTGISSRMIEDSSKLVENISEMRNLFQQSNVSESVLEQMEHHCQSLETFLPPTCRQAEPLFTARNSQLIRSTSNEIGCRFKQVKRRTNLAYLRLLRQLINEIGLDAALSSPVGVPILEAFCACPISESSRLETSLTDGTANAPATVGTPSTLQEPGDKLSQAVRLLMARGKNAVVDQELNSEFIALIEKLTNYNENTCQDVIEEGGLDYVFQACRSQDTEAVKNAVLSMVNLLHRVGRDHHYEMVRRNTFAWLFLLALNPSEEIQYYAFLIVTILSNNRELDAVLDRSQLISLMIPFVKRHNVCEFARRHFNDQTPFFSEDWLLFILPALTSETHTEVQAFAAFHFAVAAQLKSNFLQDLSPSSRAQVESALVQVSGLKREPTWKLAALALNTVGSKVPRALSLHVFSWPVEDVVCWMTREGFEAAAEVCKSLQIDGDILLGLTEEELEEGLGIKNCIAKRRFMRQLCHLKCMANYSLIDPTGVADFLTEASNDSTESNAITDERLDVNERRSPRLKNSIASTPIGVASGIPMGLLTQYTYNLLRHGITRQRLLELTEEDLQTTCHISDAIHRRQLLKAVKKASSRRGVARGSAENRIDFFISYRRSNGTHLASLVKTLLQLRKYRVFLDIERLKGGRFDHKLMDSIKRSDNFILVLTEGALDRCTTEGNMDWVRREITCALENNCHIIPLSDRFDWGNTDTLPEDIRAITKFNSVQWTPELEEGCIDRIIEFMRQNAHAEDGQK